MREQNFTSMRGQISQKTRFFQQHNNATYFYTCKACRRLLYTIINDDDNFQRKLNNERNHVAVEIFDFF